MWADLGNVSFPGVVQVELIPRDARPGLREHAAVAVTVTVDKSPRIERERALVALAKAHLEQLRRYSERVIYGVRVNGDYVMWIDSRDCMQGGRTWPREVTKWYYAGREDCER